MTYTIVTDSSCNLPERLLVDYGLVVLPLRYRHGEEEHLAYIPGAPLDYKGLFDLLRAGEVITTSLPNLADAEAAVREVLDAGNDVLYIGFSSGLSGTYDAVAATLDELAAQYPQRKVLHVDTRAAALGEGLLVTLAVRKQREGLGIDELYAWLLEERFRLCHWFTVDDLHYLVRGGRVSKTAAIGGAVLNIKPIMHMDDEGHLIKVGIVRGRRKSLAALVDRMAETATEPISGQTVYLVHGDCLEDAEYVADLIRERFGVSDFLIEYVDLVIGAHTGPGVVALFFEGSQR